MDEVKIRTKLSYTPIYSKPTGKLVAWHCDGCHVSVKVFDRNRHDCPNRPLLGVVVEVRNAEEQNDSDEQTGV